MLKRVKASMRSRAASGAAAPVRTYSVTPIVGPSPKIVVHAGRNHAMAAKLPQVVGHFRGGVRVDRPGPGFFLQGADLALQILDLGVQRDDRRGSRVEGLIGGGAWAGLQKPAEFVETRRHLAQPRGLLAAVPLLPNTRA